jgi:D-methionine transport system substrate-binding protein
MTIRRHALILVAALALSACSGGAPKATDPDRLTIAATAVPHAEILESIKPTLAAEGLTLDIRVFNDYVQPNVQVEQGQIDVNYFQNRPYLDEFNAAHGTHLVPIAGVHVEPLGAYSRRWKSAKQIPAGATVALPNDASNEGRALLLLQTAGLITLADKTNALSTPRDITGNPNKLQFRELEAATLPRVLGEVDLAVINTNYALDAKLNPTKDALFIEDANSPYVNLIVGKPGSEKDPRVIKLVKALRSDAVRKMMLERYKGAVVPAF